MAYDIDDDAVRIPDKKPPNAPRLIGQGIHDRIPPQLSGGMASIDIGDFDTDIRMRLIAGDGRHNADLGRRIGR